jgi:hypothetical protein
MIQCYTEDEFNSAKSTTLIQLECEYCHRLFERMKKDVKRAILGTRAPINCCSHSCSNSHKSPKQKVICLNCNITFKKFKSQIKKFPKHFCSLSCSATYNNKHKTTGTRRSKLEIWLESQLSTLYSNFEFHFNKKDAIGSELDIYIPALSLAFELNGIFHYEPIYGIRKLDQIQENDKSKSKACHDAKIDLCIIDVSNLIHFKPVKAQKYLDIINKIIKERF